MKEIIERMIKQLSKVVPSALDNDTIAMYLVAIALLNYVVALNEKEVKQNFDTIKEKINQSKYTQAIIYNISDGSILNWQSSKYKAE